MSERFPVEPLPLVLAVTPNLMDGVTLTEAARRLGVRVALAPVAEALAIWRRERPALVVLDLTAEGAPALIEPLAAERALTIGFYPHVRKELAERAARLGLGRAVARSAFFGRLERWLGAAAVGRLPGAGGGC